MFLGKKPIVPSLPVGSWSNRPEVNAAAIAAREQETTQASGESLRADDKPEDEAVGPVGETPEGKLYCTECYLPLHPDPPPGKLYIFLHALRYTTSHGAFETGMPWWADEKWEGEGWVQY